MTAAATQKGHLTIVVESVEVNALLLARAREIGTQWVPPVGRAVGRRVANKSLGRDRSDERLDVSGGGLDIRCGVRIGGESDNLVTNVEREDVVVLAKCRDGRRVEVEEVRRPAWVGSINRAVKRECEVDDGINVGGFT